MRAGLSFSRSPISLLLRQPLSIKKSYAGAIQLQTLSRPLLLNVKCKNLSQRLLLETLSRPLLLDVKCKNLSQRLLLETLSRPLLLDVKCKNLSQRLLLETLSRPLLLDVKCKNLSQRLSIETLSRPLLLNVKCKNLSQRFLYCPLLLDVIIILSEEELLSGHILYFQHYWYTSTGLKRICYTSINRYYCIFVKYI
jgi:hypothetical protein